LIIDPEAGSLTVVYWAVPLLSGATAAVSYRSGGYNDFATMDDLIADLEATASERVR
jgi:hypothetical protein